MKPYYSERGITIYHCDCRQILPQLGRFDLLLTDPPYGIRADTGTGKYGRLRGYTDSWDSAPADIEHIVLLDIPSVIWGANYFPLPPSRCFLVWDKAEGFKGRDFAECELAWCSKDSNAKTFRYDPLANGDYHNGNKQHPTQKPVALMKWCLSLFPDAKTVLDPFLGSGTTLVAAKAMGLAGVSASSRKRNIARLLPTDSGRKS